MDPKPTDFRAPLERSHSVSPFAAQLRLLDHAGVFLSWVSPQKALELVDRYGAELHRMRGKFREVQLVIHPDEDEDQYIGPKRQRRGKDVHNHETWYNPRGVWTFRKAA